ncbi:MAG TPA: hypothetical protein VGN34_18540, partial [Ktedonobacteraceae bacterium]
GTVALPVALDVGGNGTGFTMFSHLLSTAAATIAFDNNPGQVVTVPAASVVLAIPPAARAIITTGTPNIIYGRMH